MKQLTIGINPTYEVWEADCQSYFGRDHQFLLHPLWGIGEDFMALSNVPFV